MDDARQTARMDFLESAGFGDARLEALPGDASTRRYFRVSGGGRIAMLMDQRQADEAPAAPLHATAEERHALGYNAVARLAGGDCARFVAVAEYLRERDLSAPEIYDADAAEGFVLMEDLGDTLYTDVLDRGGSEGELYRVAVDALARLHGEAAPRELVKGKPLHSYDEVALLAETDLLTQWYLPLMRGAPTTPDEADEHRALWRAALARLPGEASYFVHRDFHAQNLLWLPQRSGAGRAGLIDFQDAVAGAASYDLVSLLEDARRDVSPELREAMIAHYLAERNLRGRHIDADAFDAAFALMAAQRNAKIVGIFARLYVRDAKPRYLGYLPRVWAHLTRDLEHPVLAPLKAWYDRTIPPDRRIPREAKI
jgi:aminoglycoside/choline kinase family phosphotransferase